MGNPLTIALAYVFIIVFVYVTMRAINSMNTRSNSDRRSRRRGMTKSDEELYHEAARIIAYLTHIREIDGEFTSDVILSDKTRAMLNQWLARYRKEIEP